MAVLRVACSAANKACTFEGGSALAEEFIDVGRAALAQYDLPPVDLRPIRLTNNAVFEVVARDTRSKGGGRHTGAAGRHVLRIHRRGYRALGHVCSELAFLRALAEDVRGTRVDVPRPIAARNGALVVEVNAFAADGAPAPLYCDLLTWVDGRVLKHGTGLGLRSSALLGEGLARVHNTAERFEQPPGFELPRWDAESMFSDASPFQPGQMERFLSPDAWALFQQVAERTQQVFDRLDAAAGQWGVIHNDYILINSLFRRSVGGWRLGILDFDDLGSGYFLYDLAPLLGNLADYPSAYPRLRRAFLDGYRSVRPLPLALEVHLPVLMAARHAVALTWLAAKQRRGETDLPIGRHVEIRVSEMARCLTVN